MLHIVALGAGSARKKSFQSHSIPDFGKYNYYIVLFKFSEFRAKFRTGTTESFLAGVVPKAKEKSLNRIWSWGYP